MTPILIYNRVLELGDMTYHACQYPGSLEQLTLAHPNHQIYLYEPPIQSLPETTFDENGNPTIGETPEPVHPTTWTPVDPVVAVCIPIIPQA
jgi:hypothetical protein